jgi:nicotinate-nucleotide--dimethylbenzimidazole phosphoribosyltransferase
MREYEITAPDEALRPALQAKIDNLNKPKGSLGRLEELALQIGLVQQTTEPVLSHPCHILFGGDHGIEREGVSVSPREVTWQQMINFTHGGAGINMFCRQHDFKLLVVDSGVDYDLMPYPGIINRKIAYGTKNFLHEAAMTEEQMEHCMDDAARLVDICNDEGCNILSIGEMGIGNTSPSSIWMHLLGKVPLEECVGAGAGLGSDGIRHKLEILQQAVDNFNKTCPPNLSERDYVCLVARYFGGFEMVAAIGAMLRAAELHLLILVDGFIMTACMLVASKLYPSILPYAIFCHEGDENGHRKLLACMGAKALLSLGLRLGEGTGAVCAYPIIESSVRMLEEMNTFEGADITKYF